jgi:hypothetical protein
MTSSVISNTILSYVSCIYDLGLTSLEQCQ